MQRNEVAGELWKYNNGLDLHECVVCGFQAWQAGAAKLTDCKDLDQCPKCGAYSRIASEHASKALQLMQRFDAWQDLTTKKQLVLFSCQSCGETVKAPMSKLGKKQRCPRCRTKNTFPDNLMFQPDGRKELASFPREAIGHEWIPLRAVIVYRE